MNINKVLQISLKITLAIILLPVLTFSQGLSSNPEDAMTVPSPFPTTTTTTSTSSTTSTLPICPISKLRTQLIFNDGLINSLYTQGEANAPACIQDKVAQTIAYCQSYLSNERIENYVNKYLELAKENCSNLCLTNSSPAFCMEYWYPSCVNFYEDNDYFKQIAAGGLLDDCVSDVLFNTMPNLYDIGEINWTISPWAQYAKRADRNCNTNSIRGERCIYHSATLFVDSQCNPLDLPADYLNACDGGMLLADYCPISLIMEDNLDINSDLRSANFPLNPQMPDKWYVWKASATAPLLVYDPTHQGVINSASQLFGNWTFGGKHLALKHSSTSISDAISGILPWVDGYEALGSIDLNGDGEVSGNELKDLGLWFDRNRDGVSQPGEVLPIQETSINKLFYRASRSDINTGDIIADRGFEQIVNGEKVIRQSIDWKAFAADSKEEVITKYLRKSFSCLRGNKERTANPLAPVTDSNTKISAKSSIDSKFTRFKSIQTPELYGFWQWKYTDPAKSSTAPRGYLSFRENLDGTISGHSFSWFDAKDSNSKSPVDTILGSRVLSGTKSVSSNGDIKIEFNISTEDGVLESTATLLNGTKIIRGHTLAKISHGTTPVDLSYDWIAERPSLE